MKYIKSKNNSQWTGIIQSDEEIPRGFVEISEEEYNQIQEKEEEDNSFMDLIKIFN